MDTQRTECLQERGSRLSATSIKFHTPSEGFNDTSLAIVSPAQRVELFGVQQSTADGQPATFEVKVQYEKFTQYYKQVLKGCNSLPPNLYQLP